jgi:hypothetical protein
MTGTLTPNDYKIIRRTQLQLRKRAQEDEENLDDSEIVCLSIGYVEVTEFGYTHDRVFVEQNDCE